jgi:hypothetical protein
MVIKVVGKETTSSNDSTSTESYSTATLYDVPDSTEISTNKSPGPRSTITEKIRYASDSTFTSESLALHDTTTDTVSHSAIDIRLNERRQAGENNKTVVLGVVIPLVVVCLIGFIILFFLKRTDKLHVPSLSSCPFFNRNRRSSPEHIAMYPIES